MPQLSKFSDAPRLQNHHFIQNAFFLHGRLFSWWPLPKFMHCLQKDSTLQNRLQNEKKDMRATPRSKKRAEKILRIVSLFCDLRGDLWWCRMPSIFISKKIESSGPRTRPSKYIKRTCNPHWLYVSVPRCYYCDFWESFLANEIST